MRDGYKILKKDSDKSSSASTEISKEGLFSSEQPMMSRSLMIRCNNPTTSQSG